MNTKTQQKRKLQKKIGSRIKELRIQNNMTQTELAFRCGCEKSNMSRIEAGNTNPSSFTLFVIARNLDIKIADIFESI